MMNTEILKKIQKDQLKKRAAVRVGDTVKMHMRISEADKSRIQIFEGIVISLKGNALDSTITVRKVSSGIGVERIIPLHSPTLEKMEVVKRGKVRRSKLYYMRDRVGRRAMKVRGSVQLDKDDTVNHVEVDSEKGVEHEVGTVEEEVPVGTEKSTKEKITDGDK